MQGYFEDVYDYQHWANTAMLRTIEAVLDLPSSIVTLYSHTINAHFIWLDRVEQQPPTYAVWQEHEVTTFASLLGKLHGRTLRLLRSGKYQTDFSDIVHYRDSKGAKFQNSVCDILTHVSNHTTHHRAQIAQQLRQQGVAPPATDYIFYKRIPIE